jgi:hypothetical protein
MPIKLTVNNRTYIRGIVKASYMHHIVTEEKTMYSGVLK